jgi:hypothetical protein
MANELTNGSSGQITFDPEKLRRVQDLLEGLKDDARKAEEDGDTYMLGVYRELLHVISPIVVRAHARIERETNAAFNKAHKALRKAERQGREAARNQTTS